MQPEQQPSMTPAEQRQRALQLLFSAASPEKSQVRKGLLLLLIAAGLEAIGPWLGKAFIDQYLLPRQLAWTEIIPLLAAFLISGWIATWLRYRQLVRLAGVAMRSVQRLREQVYSHVLKLPMASSPAAISNSSKPLRTCNFSGLAALNNSCSARWRCSAGVILGCCSGCI